MLHWGDNHTETSGEDHDGFGNRIIVQYKESCVKADWADHADWEEFSFKLVPLTGRHSELSSHLIEQSPILYRFWIDTWQWKCSTRSCSFQMSHLFNLIKFSSRRRRSTLRWIFNDNYQKNKSVACRHKSTETIDGTNQIEVLCLFRQQRKSEKNVLHNVNDWWIKTINSRRQTEKNDWNGQCHLTSKQTDLFFELSMFFSGRSDIPGLNRSIREETKGFLCTNKHW